MEQITYEAVRMGGAGVFAQVYNVATFIIEAYPRKWNSTDDFVYKDRDIFVFGHKDVFQTKLSTDTQNLVISKLTHNTSIYLRLVEKDGNFYLWCSDSCYFIIKNFDAGPNVITLRPCTDAVSNFTVITTSISKFIVDDINNNPDLFPAAGNIYYDKSTKKLNYLFSNSVDDYRTLEYEYIKGEYSAGTCFRVGTTYQNNENKNGAMSFSIKPKGTAFERFDNNKVFIRYKSYWQSNSVIDVLYALIDNKENTTPYFHLYTKSHKIYVILDYDSFVNFDNHVPIIENPDISTWTDQTSNMGIMRYLSGPSSLRPTYLGTAGKGFRYNDTDLSEEIFWDGTKWLTKDNVVAGTPISGTFSNKPTVSANNIPVGFKYFCTDKQTTEGATDGIEIIHKGNNVWVDALGRVVS